MTSHSKIAHFNSECIGSFKGHRRKFSRHCDLAPWIGDPWAKTLLFAVLQPTGITGTSPLTNRKRFDHLVVSGIGRTSENEENKLKKPDVVIRHAWVLLTRDYVAATAVVIVTLWAQLEIIKMKLSQHFTVHIIWTENVRNFGRNIEGLQVGCWSFGQWLYSSPCKKGKLREVFCKEGGPQ
jgi:hypothetical protein